MPCKRRLPSVRVGGVRSCSVYGRCGANARQYETVSPPGVVRVTAPVATAHVLRFTANKLVEATWQRDWVSAVID